MTPVAVYRTDTRFRVPFDAVGAEEVEGEPGSAFAEMRVRCLLDQEVRIVLPSALGYRRRFSIYRAENQLTYSDAESTLVERSKTLIGRWSDWDLGRSRLTDWMDLDFLGRL